MHLLVDI